MNLLFLPCLLNVKTGWSDFKFFIFSEADFLKIWKGLHYCMWMQDKPLIQVRL